MKNLELIIKMDVLNEKEFMETSLRERDDFLIYMFRKKCKTIPSRLRRFVKIKDA